MKKLSVLLVAMAVAVSASAGVSLKNNRAIKHNKVVNTEMTKINPKSLKTQAANLRVITEQPEGEAVVYDRSGDAIYAYSGISYGEQSGRMTIVYGEDGKVYLQNILYGCGDYFGESWVEGTLEDNVITVPMGQSIYWSDYYGADVVLGWGSTMIYYDEEGDPYLDFALDNRVTEVEYIIDGDHITGPVGTAPVEDVDNPYWHFEATGLSCYWTDDNSFGGFVEWNTELDVHIAPETPTVITEQPEGSLYTYYRRGYSIYSSWFYGIVETEVDGKVNVVFGTDGKVYIQNPLWYADTYNTWVEGTYDWMTGIISIPTGQYLSWNEDYEYGVQLVWGSSAVEEGVDEDGETAYYFNYEIADYATEIQFMIDGDYIYLLGCEGDPEADFPDNYVATGMLGKWSDDDSFICLEFVGADQVYGQMVNLVPAVPAMPTADEWYDCGDESGFSKFYFTLPTEDIDGNPLDPEYLSYAVWINDGEGNVYQFTFPAEDYTYDLTYDIDEVPYWIYSSAVDFRDYFVYMYRTNENDNPLFIRDTDNGKYGNIGIQVFYTVGGVKNACEDIAWLYEKPVAVNELNATKTVANVRYFNVAGQEMAQPEGMTIKVTTYTDGTTSAVKVVK